MADLSAYIQSKIDDFRNTVQSAAQGVGSAVGGAVQGVENYFNPESNGGQNFWSSPVAQGLGAAQQAATNLSNSPLTFAEQAGQAVQNAVPGPAGQIAGGVTRFGLGIPESVANVPQNIAMAGRNIGVDVRTGQILQPRVAASDIAQAALPVATIASLGGVGAVAETAAKEGILQAAGQGALQGAKYGAGFGLLSGIGQGRNTSNPLQYAGNVAQNVATQAAVGGLVGGVSAGGVSAISQGVANLRDVNNASPESVSEPSPNAGAANQAEKSLTPDVVNKYGQDLFQTDQKQKMAQMVAQATQDKPNLDTAFKGIADQTGSDFESRLKAPETMFQKVILKRSQGRDYGIDNLNDVYGGRITVTDPAQSQAIGQGLDALQKSGAIKIISDEPVVKDTYSAYHIDFETPGGTKGELQIMSPQENAESLVNHGIRSQYGENPPPQVEAIKEQNAQAVKSLPDAQAQAVTDQLVSRNKVNPEAASEPMSIASQGPLPWEKEGAKNEKELLQPLADIAKNNTNVNFFLSHPKTAAAINDLYAQGVEDPLNLFKRNGYRDMVDFYEQNKGTRVLPTLSENEYVLSKGVDPSSDNPQELLKASFYAKEYQTKVANGEIAREATPPVPTPSELPVVPQEPIPRNKEGEIDRTQLTGQQLLTPSERLKGTMYGLAPEPGSPEAEAMNKPPQEPGQPALDPQYVAQQARLARSGAVGAIQFQARTLASQLDQVLRTPQDNLNFRLAVENPDKLAEYAATSSNPQAFTQLAQRYSNFTDFIFNQFQNKNLEMNYVQDYFTHIWDLSTPEAQQTYNDLLANIRNSQSGFTKDRFFETIQQGLDAGLTLKNPNVSQDVIQYAQSMGNQVGAAAFNQRINELRPGGAIEGAGAYNFQGKPFLQSNVPGNQGTFIDPEIQKYMGVYSPSAFANLGIVKGWDVQIGDNTIHLPGADDLNQILKQIKLGGGGFHALNTTLRQTVNDPTIIPRATANMFDIDARNAFNQKAIDDGVIAAGTKAGVTYGNNADIQKGTLLDTVKGFNPITRLNNAVFGGLINTYKINLTRGMMEKFPNMDTDPVQMAQAQEYAKQINSLMGGLNYEAIGRNKTLQQIFRFLGLAPDFSEGSAKQIFAAGNPLGYANQITRPAAVFALRNVVGQVALYASLAEAGRFLTTGSFSTDFKSFVDNSILRPNIPLPNNAAFNNPKTGKTQSAFLPTSEFGTFASAVNDPTHFLQARGSALLSAAESLRSGKDYYGNPLVNPWNGTPDTLVNRLKAIGPSQLPIPVQQAGKLAAGTQTPADTALNILGTRVANNPNDPKTIEATNFFNLRDQLAKGLNPNEQQIFSGVLHPTTKDPAGNLVVDKTPYNTPEKYVALLQDPKLLAAEQQLQTAQPNHDPLWDLKGQDLLHALQYYSLKAQNPTTGFSNADPTVKALQQSLPQGFFNARGAFFNSLVQQGIMQPSTGPQTPPAVTNFWNQYYQYPQGSAQRKTMLQSPAGIAALAYISQEQNLTNQQRADMGLPLLAATGGGSSGGRSGYSSNRARYGNFGFIGNTMIPRPRIPLVRTPKGKLNYKVAKAPKAKLKAAPKLTSSAPGLGKISGVKSGFKSPKIALKATKPSIKPTGKLVKNRIA
ncbi:MAG: hypothetical protein C5B59_12800 [Bacteroidetes bacterium]|nr:MAG: hypothetical protein C5B59_12800 [Bacteroidota bacterium]